MEATVGDTVVVNLHNKLGNQTTGLHFHGINQVQTQEMDGPSGVTQCPLPPDSSLTYQFVVDAPGTYWCMSQTLSRSAFATLTSRGQTTPITWGSTPMACAAPSSFMTPMTLIRTSTTRRLS